MAAITTGGSVLDINTIVSQLITLERQQKQQPLVAKEAAQTAKLSAFGQVKGVLAGLQTAVDALKTAGFDGVKATISGKGFTASAATGAAGGNYAVEVFQLAKEQRIATNAGSSFAPAAGKLNIQFGSVEAGVFAGDPARTASLDFEGGTLVELRDAINGNATLGIKANIINNGERDQLVLTSTATGQNMAFKLTGEDGLAGLTYDPAGTPSPGDALYSVQAAQNSRVTIDGIEITRAKNTISDAIAGVSLTLTEEPESGAGSLKGSVSVSTDDSAAKAAIEAFVKAYNDTSNTLKGLTAYDSENRQSAALTGDSTIRSIQSQLRNSINETFAGLGGASSLGEIGFEFARDGTLSVNSAKLGAALTDPANNVAALFIGTDDIRGFAATFSARLDGILDSRTGIIAGRTDSLNANIKSLTEQFDKMESRIISLEARYRQEYSRLDSLLASMGQTSNYLTQQLAGLSQFSSSNR